MGDHLSKYHRVLSRKRSTSMIHQINSSQHSYEMLKESRRVILDGINEKLNNSRKELEEKKL